MSIKQIPQTPNLGSADASNPLYKDLVEVRGVVRQLIDSANSSSGVAAHAPTHASDGSDPVTPESIGAAVAGAAPTAHKSSHAISGSDALSPADIGALSSTTLRTELNASGSAPIYAFRAWVSFDGTRDSSGASSTSNTNRYIYGSGNVASVLRNSAGNYTVTLSTAMQDNNYCPLCTSKTTGGSSGYFTLLVGTKTTTSVTLNAVNSAGSSLDSVEINVGIVR